MKLKVFSTMYVVLKDNKIVIWNTNMLDLHKQLMDVTSISYSYLTLKFKDNNLVEWDGYKLYKLNRPKE